MLMRNNCLIILSESVILKEIDFDESNVHMTVIKEI